MKLCKRKEGTIIFVEAILMKIDAWMKPMIIVLVIKQI